MNPDRDLPKEEREGFDNDVTERDDALTRNPSGSLRRDDPNDRQETTQGTGPDAIIGHSAATGEPLTKREVFPEGSSMLEQDLASQPNDLGPQLGGAASPPDEPHRSPSAEHDAFGRSLGPRGYADEETVQENLRVEERLHEPDVYESEDKGSAGWHEAGTAYDPKLVPTDKPTNKQ